MKSLCYLFSFMIVLLNYMPCNDAVLKYSNTNSFSVEEKDNNQKHAEADVCSPFCTCTCCTSPTVTQVQLHVINLPINIDASYTDHLAGKFIDVSIPVWQPPKLA